MRAFARSAYRLDYSHQQRNGNAAAQRVSTTELVWERYQGRSVPRCRHWNDIDRLISLVDNPDAVGDFDRLLFKNEGHVTARGIEFEGEVQLVGRARDGQLCLPARHRRSDQPGADQLSASPREVPAERACAASRGSFSVEANAISRRLTLTDRPSRLSPSLTRSG
jgi:hypothetical protein